MPIVRRKGPALKVKIRPCCICGYQMSDRHHVFPKAEACDTFPAISLCPNHHRHANLLQQLLLAGNTVEQAAREMTRFADDEFCQKALLPLARLHWNANIVMENGLEFGDWWRVSRRDLERIVCKPGDPPLPEELPDAWSDEVTP